MFGAAGPALASTVLLDAPRPGRPPKHGPDVWQRIQTRVCQQPEAHSRWTDRTLARDLALPAATVHEVLVESGLQPHHARSFTFTPDPKFEAKLLDVVLGGWAAVVVGPGGLLETADGLTQATAEFRQAIGAEDQRQDGRDQQQFRKSKLSHVSGPSGLTRDHPLDRAIVLESKPRA